MRQILTLSAIALVLAPLTASAELGIRRVGCSDRARMVDKLTNGYLETRRGAGMEVSEGVVELFVSEAGSWTLLLTQPDGKSCPLAAGDGWRDIEPIAIPKGDPT